MRQVIVITGASSGFGALAARALARAGHTVYASMRETAGRNARPVDELRTYSAEHHVDLRAVELDVKSQESCGTAIQKIISESGALDVVIHNAGHMVFGPTEAFTPEQFADLYDTNVLGTQRVNRRASAAACEERGTSRLGLEQQHPRRDAALSGALLRSKGSHGLPRRELRGGARPVGDRDHDRRPGRLHVGDDHFKNAGAPAAASRAAAYAMGAYQGFAEAIQKGLMASVPLDANVAAVAEAIVDVVGKPPGTRPFRVHVDPAQDGCEVVNAVTDRVRAEFLRRIGLGDLLQPQCRALSVA